MPWPKGTDPEEKVRIEVKALLVEFEVRCLLDTERVTPRTQARVVSAEEMRTAIPHRDEETGKWCDWQKFEVIVDVIGDDKTPKGQLSSVASGVFAVFRDINFPARNEHGIYTATVRKDKNVQSDKGELENPFVVTCDTFTFIE